MDKFEIDYAALGGLDPFNADSDDDGTFDAFEDPDGDGLNNLQEWSYSANPCLADTDGDGASDGVEAGQGSDPTDPADGGNPPDPDDVVKFELRLGPNGGEGAWFMVVGQQAIFAEFHQTAYEVRTFKKGNSYPIRISHAATHEHYWLATCRESYAYEAWVTLDSPAGACFIIDDPDILLNCAHPEPNPRVNPVKNKTATLHVLNFDLKIDSNNDGIIDDDDDPIEEAAPGRLICLNDDDDNGGGSPDKDDTGATDDEDDLVTLQLPGDPPPPGYKWKLTFPSTKVKIWFKDDRSNDGKTAIVSGQTREEPPPSECYVEGFAVSAAPGDISIVLAYTKPDDTEICSDTVTATVMRLSFLGKVAAMDNQAIPVTESLQVSNFLTTAVLPAASAFAAGNADPDNFRLEVEDASIAGASVQVKLEIVRGGNVQPNPVTYTLDKKVGTKFRGEYLRLVSDTVDDAASGGGPATDPGNQTILVEIGDIVRLTYRIGAIVVCTKEIPVCRPSSENEPNAIRRAQLDLRIGFIDADGNGARDAGEEVVTPAAVQAEADVADERWAQVCVRFTASAITYFQIPPSAIDGAGHFRIDDPNNFAGLGPGAVTVLGLSPPAGGQTVTVYFVPPLTTAIAEAYPPQHIKVATDVEIAAGRSPGAGQSQANSNTVFIGTISGDSFDLAHEMGHILLNTNESPQAATVLFPDGIPQAANNVNAAKRLSTSAAGSIPTNAVHAHITGVTAAGTTYQQINNMNVPTTARQARVGLTGLGNTVLQN